nr:type VI secretion system tip protein VgrG [uncultured Albidiferax sp.]
MSTTLASLLSGWSQTDRLLRLHTPLDDPGSSLLTAPSLLAERLHAIEGLYPANHPPNHPANHPGNDRQGHHAAVGADPRFCGTQLLLSCLSLNAHLDLDALVGQPVLLELLTDASRTDLRPFHGHIRCAQLLGANGGLARYQLTIEPWLSALGQQQDSAIYQGLNVFDILDAIFKDYQGQGRLQPQWRFDIADKAAYPTRSLTTQYAETDLAFVTRLMAEEGLFGWFEHTGDPRSPALGSHTFVIADHNGAFQPNPHPEVEFTQVGATMARDSIDRWRSHGQWSTHTVALSSWDYRSNHTRPVSAQRASTIGTSADDTGHASSAIALTHRDDPGAYAFENAAQGQRLARNQLQALNVRQQHCSGAGTLRSAAPGSTIVLNGQHKLDRYGQPPPAAQRTYTLLRVQHLARNNLDAALGSAVQQRLGPIALTPPLPGTITATTALHVKSAPNAHSIGVSSYQKNNRSPVELEDSWWTGTVPGEAHGAGPLDPTDPSGPTDSAHPANASQPFYRNRLDALPAHIPYRGASHGPQGQRLHPKPTVHSQQTAIVVGPAGQVVYTDRDHRIKLQFHWQRDTAGQSGSHARLSHPSSARQGGQGRGQGHTGAPANEKAGTWVRVAATLAPTAGANWGSVAIPRIGQEVWVDFLGGDIDRPVVTGCVYNGSGAPDAQYNQQGQGAGAATGNAPTWFPGQSTESGKGHAHPAVLSGIKTQALSASQHGAGGYNQLVFDDSPSQARTVLQQHSQAHQGTAELNLGQLQHQSDNQRLHPAGWGAELKTAHSAATRAGAGLLLSADARAGASRSQLDSTEAQAQADSSQQLQTRLADTAQKHNAGLKTHTGQAEPAPDKLPAIAAQAHNVQVRATQDGPQDQQVDAYSEPLLQLSAPSGIQALTPADAILSGGATSSITAGQAIQFGAQGGHYHLVKAGISFFTYGKVGNPNSPNQETGIALIAASGKVSSQSQSGPTKLTADKDLTVASTTAAVSISAKLHLLLTAGGSGIRIEGGNITITGASVQFEASAKELAGPGSVGGSLELPKPGKLAECPRALADAASGGASAL